MSEEQPQIEGQRQEQPKVEPVKVERGLLMPTNSAELSRTLQNIASGGGFPARFDTPQKRLAAYTLGRSLMGDRWQLAMNNIAEIKGQLSIYGELPGALAEQTKEVEEKHVYVIDPDYRKICVENKNLDAPLYAGVCDIKRKGRERKQFTYTLDEARHAGQYPAKKRDGSVNEDSPWMKFTKIMLMRKAMAMAINFEFPDAKAGVPIAEYDFDVLPERDVSPKNNIAEEINNAYLEKEAEPAAEPEAAQ